MMNREESYKIFSEFYDDLIARNCPDLHEKYYQFITKFIAENRFPRDSILDATCGTGILMKKMSDNGYKVSGMDINKHMLSKAKRKNLEVFPGDIKNFETKSRFDVIISFDSLNHLAEDDELIDALNSVNRNLNPGGVFIFDGNTKNKINRQKNETYSYDSQNYSFVWVNHEICGGYVNVELKITKNTLGNIKEFVEHHCLRGYDLDEVVSALNKAGFEAIYKTLEPIAKDGSFICAAIKK